MYYRKFLAIVALIMSVLVVPEISRASIKMDGYFIAKKSCEAVHSIRKGTDPFTLTKGMGALLRASKGLDCSIIAPHK
ncbi:MAG TPA: hypothetical protein ENL02_04490 [Epsilonproteobacteria bacterium]|nr:hypothetical protein [Campylobacterota bacterium]